MARTPAPKDRLDEIADVFPDFDEEQALTLREMGMADPLPDCPMLVELTAGAEPEPIEPGDWRSLGFVNPRSRLPANCPVTPLGKDKGVCYVLDTMGAVAELDAKSSGKGPIGYIFAGRSQWLEWAWPRFGKAAKGMPPPVTGWDADDARQALVDACAYEGYFELDDQVRGRGAWVDDDGKLIYHAGDQVYIDGKWRPLGVHGRFIYPGRKKVGRPSRRPQPAGPGSPGDHLLELLRTFTWERGELDARLMLGWLMTAKVGGALPQRPVAFITGGEGSGKSTLHKLLRVVMNDALIKTSNTTQAGIYQRVQQDSVAIMVDELEAKEDTRTVDKILELARIAYSGDTLDRGGKDGVGKSHSLFSSFLGSSIAKPATDAQADSRMAVLMLRERETAGGKLDVSWAELDAMGQHLLRRWFDWWPKWEALQAVFRAELIRVGHNDRACDTFGPLAAATHVALSDDMPTKAELEEWGAWLKADALEETASRERSWERCFWYLMDANPEALRTNAHHKTIGSAVQAFQRQPTEAIDDLGKVLKACGMALSFCKGADKTIDHARLFVPIKSPPLHALFEGTPWAGRQGAPGPWHGVLKQMPREFFTVSTCDLALNKAAKGLMIKLSDVIGKEEVK